MALQWHECKIKGHLNASSVLYKAIFSILPIARLRHRIHSCCKKSTKWDGFLYQVFFGNIIILDREISLRFASWVELKKSAQLLYLKMAHPTYTTSPSPCNTFPRHASTHCEDIQSPHPTHTAPHAVRNDVFVARLRKCQGSFE